MLVCRFISLLVYGRDVVLICWCMGVLVCVCWLLLMCVFVVVCFCVGL